MQLFYTPDILGDIYTLSVDESRHAVQVLRLREGDSITLIDGRGGLYCATIIVASPKSCTVEVTDRTLNYGLRPRQLHIAIAPTKNIDRFEWFLEKATEIGIDRITPLLCERSERKVIKSDRCEKVLLSAAKQSIKAFVPRFDELISMSNFLKNLDAISDTLTQDKTGSRADTFKDEQAISDDLALGNTIQAPEIIKNTPAYLHKFIAHCDTSFDRTPLRELVDSPGATNFLILIGAEGDFSPSEIQQAYDAGFVGISLGTSRLRTETAAVVATSIISI